MESATTIFYIYFFYNIGDAIQFILKASSLIECVFYEIGFTYPSKLRSACFKCRKV